MTFGFLSGSRNFCKLLWVSCEVFVLHGYAWIHWVAESCTTTAYRWLFRDSQLSLRTLWSAVIKSPKFSTRSTTLPIRLLHGALVILVLWQISQIRSFGKWVLTLCLPISALLIGSEDGSWEELACESLCSETLSSTRFSENSCNHSGMSEYGLPCTYSWSSFFIWFWDFVWLSQQLLFRDFRRARVSPYLSIHTFTWLDCWMVIWLINFLTWRSRGCWGRRAWKIVDKPRTTIGTKFSALHFFRIPFSMRFGFWPWIHSYEYLCSSQSFPSDNTAGVSSRSSIVKNISNSLT